MNKSELFFGLLVMLLLALLGVSFILNLVVSNNVSLNEFIEEFNTKSRANIQYSEVEGIKQYTYQWISGRKRFKVEFTLNEENYNYFKNLPRKNDYAYYINSKWYLDNYNESDLDEIIFQIISIAKTNDLSDVETANMILNFVQAINSDTGFSEDSKFPYELLYELEGDCKSTSILAAYILNRAGFKTIIIEFEDHVGVGVNIDVPGISYIYEGVVYAYGETTGSNHIFGNIPEEYEKQIPQFFHTAPESVVDLKWHLESRFFNQTHNEYRINIDIINLGNVKINPLLKARVLFKTENKEETFLEQDFFIDKKSKISIKENFIYKNNLTHKIIIQAKGNNFNKILQESDWISTS